MVSANKEHRYYIYKIIPISLCQFRTNQIVCVDLGIKLSQLCSYYLYLKNIEADATKVKIDQKVSILKLENLFWDCL